MGPQLYRCGNLAGGAIGYLFSRLQWGRNFIVAETGSTSASSARPACFNGAATLSLRKHSGWPPRCRSVRALQWGRNFIVAETTGMSTGIWDTMSLQWGRNFIVAETRQQVPQPGRGVRASMGPQLYRCGNPTLFMVVCAAIPSFNGAATLSLRKREDRRARPAEDHRASMGPQLYRYGNRVRTMSSVYMITRLQWGRNFIVAEIA